MALPELTLPTTFPPFAAGGHEIEPESVYAMAPRRTGADRRRRVFTTAPRILQCTLELTQAQLEEFHAWHEGPLKAGQEPFAAQVAKVGPGTEWWKANIVGTYKARHQQGNLHVVQMTLKLTGAPSATAPALTTLASEMSMALGFGTSSTFGNNLASEMSLGIELLAAVDVSMFSEMRMPLYTQFGSPPTSYTPLESEMTMAMEFVGAGPSSPALSSEMTMGLSFVNVPDSNMASEMSMPLAFAEEDVGFIASPGTVTVSDVRASSPGIVTSALVQVRNDGSIYSRVATGPFVLEELYYTPVTPGLGAPLWVRAVVASGVTPNVGDSVGSWISLASNRGWALQYSDSTNRQSSLTISVASDPDGAVVVSSFTANLETEVT